MVNPFDLKSALLAKHAQHVVLIHFPIALFISAVAFDLIAHLTKRRDVADAAYYNLLVAAISTFPVLATGVLAWQFQLEGPCVCMCLDGNDLAGFVGAFPRAMAGRSLAALPPGG
jgi:uncharacterized membrane protein